MRIKTSFAQLQLPSLIDSLNRGSDAVIITSEAGNAVLISETEYSNLLENIYIMKNPVFGQSILDGRKELAEGHGVSYSIPELLAMLATDAPTVREFLGQ